MALISDKILIEQLHAENEYAFRLLYKFYFSSIKSHILRNTGNAQDAEDIFQEAVVVLLQQIRKPDFSLNVSLKTYLFAIAKNLWLKQLRQKKYRESIGSSLAIEAESFTVEIVSEPTREEKLMRWLLKISDNCQYMLRSLYFYQLSMESLMQTMGWKNRHTADNLKYKCLQQIRRAQTTDLSV